MARQFSCAIVGATGAVGEAFLAILEERQFPVSQMYALASKRSEGSTVLFKNRPILVEDLESFDFDKVDLAFFAVGNELAEKYVPRATAAGAIVIDNSSAFRLDPDVPLIVPEVNRAELYRYTKKNLIANPNCSTIQMAVALKPIYDEAGITRVNVCTYQSVAGQGMEGISELATQTAELLNGRSVKPQVFSKRIAFNVIPHIDVFLDNGYTAEEMKMALETKKIFQDDNLLVNASCVRVPVFYGHSEAIHIETTRKITLEKARALLQSAPGVTLYDDPKKNAYPTPAVEAAGEDAVYVGRLREDISHPQGLCMWVVSDPVRKGAALNAIQIAETLIEQFL